MDDGRTVAIISDFGADSFYAGVMRSVVMHAAPKSRVVDVTHGIRAHGIAEGSFVLDTVFDYFPTGTVFLVVVDPGVGGSRRNLAVELGERFFVGPDNGLLTEVAERTGRCRAYHIDPAALERFCARRPLGWTFLGRDVFAPAAAAIATGADPAAVGRPVEDGFETLGIPRVTVGPGRVSGCGRYVDVFGNMLTRISRGDIDRAFGKSASDRIRATVDGHELGPLCECYGARPTGTMIAVLNSWGLVEISVTGGRAVDRFGGRRPDEVILELRAEGA
jgi:S-adenosylmethionine hydrolase